MRLPARLCCCLLLCSANLIPQTAAPTPTPAATAEKSTTAAALQLQDLLDRNDYLAYSNAIARLDPNSLTPTQRQYFLGMLAFRVGKLEPAIQFLTLAVNANSDKSLSSNQVVEALIALGHAQMKLGHYGAAAQMFDDIDKAFGARLGAGEQSIRDQRHVAALLQHVPPLTATIPADFTLTRTGWEYPVTIPGANPPVASAAQLDTGAELSLLTASTAKAWGVTLLNGSATLNGYGGGSFHAQPGVVRALKIGGAELQNLAVYVVPDEQLLIPQIKKQINALLGYPVLAALGRLTFSSKDGTVTVSAQSPARDLQTSAALWFGDHSLLVELGTDQTSASSKRLFQLDTGSGSTWLTDRYLAEHKDAFQGAPPETARLAGADGLHESPAYAAKHISLFAGAGNKTELVLDGQHVLTQPQMGESGHYYGVIGRDVLEQFARYTIDLRNMTLTLAR